MKTSQTSKSHRASQANTKSRRTATAPLPSSSEREMKRIASVNRIIACRDRLKEAEQRWRAGRQFKETRENWAGSIFNMNTSPGHVFFTR